MPLILRDRLGVFSLFPLFFINLVASTAAVILHKIYPVVATVALGVYVYVLLLQTRLMALLLVSGWVTTPIIAQFTHEFSVDVAVYSMGVFTASVVAAHLIAIVLSAITGFRI
ncbi:hypothetical protein [Halorussus marinus]|jgi:hypothetical protein|uniref:hypothetical protein n=1 Tax=Halorussus marinus TaxID=2505976 RepID=UPI00106EF5BE|nr:hypothetical protein [Halorussus marinus]